VLGLSGLAEPSEVFHGILGILSFRLFPFVAYVSIKGRYRWFTRCFAVLGYVAIVVLAARTGPSSVPWLALSYVYFCGAGWAAYELLPHVRSRMVWFLASALLFLVVPSALVRPPPMSFLAVGWEAMLKAYSYGVEARRPEDRTLPDFLFFLLVNPVLAYRRRGRPLPSSRPGPEGVVRFVWGVLVTLCAIGVLQPLHAQAAHRGPRALVVPWLFLLVVGALRLLGEYAVQSGVASIKIGVMRQLGYEVPERFHYPLFARSPADFWRRWNTYVGDWARTYVFLPLMLGLSRRARTRDRRLPYAASIIVTLGAVGLLHDAYIVAADGRLRFPGTLWFVAVGVVVVAWEAVGSLFGESRVRTWLERVLFLVVASYAATYLWW